jgi:hypothetical protein
MERKRVAGKFASENGEGNGETPNEAKGAGKSPRGSQCRAFTRNRVAEALPKIVDTFIEEAKKGSIAHTKLLTALGGLDKGDLPVVRKRRRKSAVTVLMEKMMREPETTK